ncbi:MAG: OmpH family outer membrane protein [Pyrinomonadaceae bacterium]
MKTFRLTAVSFIFAMICVMSGFAQAQAPAKIALVDTDAFYDTKEGIAKIINAYKSLETEFKPTQTELENGAKRLQALQAEIQKLQTQANDPNNKVPIDKNAAQAKVDEYERLQRDMKFKQEDAKARYEKREQALIGPIVDDIGKALGEFAKQKGYTMILDIGKMYNQRIVVFWENTPDITKEFVQYYNTRPAGTAATKPQ